jgi:hypothetical protein
LCCRNEELDGFENARWPQSQSSSFTDMPTGQLLCPVRELPTAQGTGSMYYDPVAFTYRGCHCPSNGSTYWNIDLEQCVGCPHRGYLCDHTQVFDMTKAIIVKVGYYPLLNGTFDGRVNSWPTPTLLGCSVPSACNPTSDAQFKCAPGYDIESLMCSRCLNDYYQVNGQCQECPSQPLVSLITLTSIAMVALIIGVSQWTFKTNGSALLSMVVFWFQLSDVLDTDIAQRAEVSDDAPVVSRFVASVFGLQDIAGMDMSMINCWIRQQSQFAQLLYMKIIMFAIFQSIVLTFALYRCYRRKYGNGVGGDESVNGSELPSLIGVRLLDEDEVILAAAAAKQRSPRSSEESVNSSKCSRLMYPLLMVCHFLIEALYLPLSSQLMQVREYIDDDLEH